MFLLLAVAEAVIFIAGSFFITEARPAESRASSPGKQASDIPDVMTRDMLRSGVFWKLYIFQMLIVAVGVGVISIAKDVSLTVGNAESSAVLIVGLLSVCNGIGRVLCGISFDRIGRRQTIFLALVLALIATVVTLGSVLMVSLPMNTVGLLMIGLMHGFMPPISAGGARSLFGVKYFPVNLSVVNSMMIPASFSSTIVGAMIAQEGNFVGVFIMMLCFVLGSAGIFLNLKKYL
jgi:OFA family oxalate/formate antiporter-like MFS transporter